MHQTTKLKLIAWSIVLGVITFIAVILNFALSDEPTFTASGALPTERLQTYTVQGLTVQTTTTPDMFAILALVSLAKDQQERLAILKEARVSFYGNLEQFNQLLNPLKLTEATSTPEWQTAPPSLDKAKADCEAAGASFAVYPMADEPGKTVTAYCNIKAREIFRGEF